MKTRIRLNIGYAEGDGNMVEIGDRMVHGLIHVAALGSVDEPRLDVTIDSRSGVPRCTEFRLSLKEDGATEIRTKDLRAISIGDLIDAVVPLFADEITERHENGGVSGVIRVPDSDSEDYRRARSQLRNARKESRRKVTPELLEAVASVYASDSERPAEAVRRSFGVSPRTAHRYISAAREAGLIEKRKS